MVLRHNSLAGLNCPGLAILCSEKSYERSLVLCDRMALSQVYSIFMLERGREWVRASVICLICARLPHPARYTNHVHNLSELQHGQSRGG
jgi:hypothetical protein